MCFLLLQVSLGVFVHHLDVHARVSRVAEVHAGQFDLALIALGCCGDHPFADVLCLGDLSFPFLVQEYSDCVLLSEAPAPIFHGHHLHPSSSLRSSSNRSPLFKHLAIFCNVRGCLRVVFLLFFLLLLLCLPFPCRCGRGRVGSGSCRRCGVCVCCSCTSAKCSSARRRMPSRMLRILLQPCLLLDCSSSPHSRIFVRACCVPLLQNAYWHITVCVREHTAFSSSCLSCMTARSHAIVVLHVVLLMTAQSLSYWFLSSTDSFFRLFALVLLRVCGT